MKYAVFFFACLLVTSCLEGSVEMKTNPRPEIPYTTFQTPTPYRTDHDIRTDAVIVYSSNGERIQSWKDKGYVVQTMYGFRTGTEYIKNHPEEGQTMANGEILTCGPGSHYMVPTQSRIDAAIGYYREAVKNGTSMVVPEEPEFFIQTGYSESFKKEWQAYYGEPWVDQTTSTEARWKSSRLKGYLEYRMVKSILDDVKEQNPDVVRAVAIHSPVSYYHWGIIYPHFQALPEVQEVIGQVWTGTARSPCRYEGVMAERTFENGYLEYSSLYNLVRGTGKRMWFLMDPLEDNPDRSMEDYQTNYERTLVASLMFPEVDAFEVMPWPDRIFGRVPPEFATKIMTIVTMLGDIHNQPASRLITGTQGIATFVADSMAWQRGEPQASNYDCFYGLTLPLIMKGIPVQVAQLERTPEPKYLDPYKVLLVSYDIMKPMDPAYNEALADWVNGGGALLLYGGEDAYNDLPEWWQEAGFRSPQAHLLDKLGLKEEEGIYSVGKGTAQIISKPASYYATSRESADELRAIVSLACERAGIRYIERHDMKVRRGRYVAARAFDKPATVKGKFVDVLDPGLRIVTDPILEPDGLGVYADVSKELADSKPRVMLTSSRIEAIGESETQTAVMLSGPTGTKGAARISTAGKRVKGVVAEDSSGAAVPFEQKLEDGSLVITHDSLPEGVIVRIDWE